MASWGTLLDALEERSARIRALLDGHADVPDLPVIVLQADGPLPADLRLRAVVLLEESERQERRVTERRQQLVRASAYAEA